MEYSSLKLVNISGKKLKCKALKTHNDTRTFIDEHTLRHVEEYFFKTVLEMVARSMQNLYLVY
jgi:hypothetical protein